MLSKIRPHLPASFNSYYEPFLGGGAMLFDLRPRRAYINDIHPLIYQAFADMQDGKAKEIKNEYLALQAEYTALDTPARKAKIKEYLARLNARLRTAQDVTALFCFLTKNCFCAQFTQKKNGSYLCSWGEFTAFDSDNFDRAADFLQSADITISNGDYENALSTADAGDFVFLDPPYSRPKATTFINYNADTFKDAAQERLAAVYRELDARGVLLMETNYDTPETRRLYDGFEFIPIRNRTHIASSDNYEQVMIRNYTN